jgi:hypothetical protein
MANRQDHDFFPVIVIQRKICAMSEFNDPFAELWRHFFNRAAHLRVPGKRFNTLPDRFDGAPGGVSALGSQKGMKAGDIQERRFGPL